METHLLLANKKFKTVPSVNKIMATIFWDAQGILFVDFPTRGETVNAAGYCSTLNTLREAVHQKMNRKYVRWCDYAPCQCDTRHGLADTKMVTAVWEVLQHFAVPFWHPQI
jgi:hypothetical protein